MEIASDRVKDAANVQKHGVSLADAVHLDWSSLLIATETRRDYGEDRYQGFGVIGGRLYFVAFRPVTTPCGLSASEKQITGRYTTMSKTKLGRNTPEEEAAINRGIAADPDAAAPSTQEIKALRPFPEVTAERRMGRPPKEHRKEQVSVRYDADVIAAFRATGEGWQTRMNNALRTYLSEHPLKAA